MKILLRTSRILLFLSFFLPFMLFPNCKGHRKNAEKEKAVRDSIRFSDSIRMAERCSRVDTAILVARVDSCVGTSKLSVDDDRRIFKEMCMDALTDFNLQLQYPTKDSISGYGIFSNIIIKFSWPDIISLIFVLSFVCSLIGVFLLFVRQSHVIQIINSATCLLMFIVYWSCMFIGNLKILEFALWGLWVSLILNIVNMVVTILMRRNLVKRQARGLG